MEGKLEGFEPVKAGWELHGFLDLLAAWGLVLEWGLSLRVAVQVTCLGEELIPLHLHDLVDICGVECFLLSIGV